MSSGQVSSLLLTQRIEQFLRHDSQQQHYPLTSAMQAELEKGVCFGVAFYLSHLYITNPTHYQQALHILLGRNPMADSHSQRAVIYAILALQSTLLLAPSAALTPEWPAMQQYARAHHLIPFFLDKSLESRQGYYAVSAPQHRRCFGECLFADAQSWTAPLALMLCTAGHAVALLFDSTTRCVSVIDTDNPLLMLAFPVSKPNWLDAVQDYIELNQGVYLSVFTRPGAGTALKRLWTILQSVNVSPHEIVGRFYRKPSQCRLCKKDFKSERQLIQHFNEAHPGEMPFVCSQEGCLGAFGVSTSLKEHLRIHTGERPYVCTEPECRGAFAHGSTLKLHLSTHTRARPFVSQCQRFDCDCPCHQGGVFACSCVHSAHCNCRRCASVLGKVGPVHPISLPPTQPSALESHGAYGQRLPNLCESTPVPPPTDGQLPLSTSVITVPLDDKTKEANLISYLTEEEKKSQPQGQIQLSLRAVIAIISNRSQSVTADYLALYPSKADCYLQQLLTQMGSEEEKLTAIQRFCATCSNPVLNFLFGVRCLPGQMPMHNQTPMQWLWSQKTSLEARPEILNTILTGTMVNAMELFWTHFL